MSDRTPVRVLHLVPRFRPGGVARVITALVGGDDERFQSAVAFGANDWPAPLNAIGAASYTVPLFPSTPLTFLRALRVLRKIVREKRFDVIHSHHRFSSLVGRAAAALSGARFVCSVHDFAGGNRFLTRMALGREIMVYGQGVARYLRDYFGLRDARITKITMGVPPPEPVPSSAGDEFRSAQRIAAHAPIILFAGRLEDEKAPDVLIEAVPRVVLSVPDAVVCIAGDGPMKPELERAVNEGGLTASVRFLGWRDDADRLMAAADVVILLRRGHEPFGLTVVEAMLRGKPVVASDAGSLRDLVTDRYTGIFVEGLTSDAIAEAVITLLTDRELAKRLGAAAREHAAATWTVWRMIDETRRVYLEALNAA
ncbi:MAG TPA: glycosyltransferase family 4 protein [Thermoanaerobaculia bacterium]|jgi:glycosyltransferase involved in cell wall biosynthesis